jgi:hypothetical protein
MVLVSPRVSFVLFNEAPGCFECTAARRSSKVVWKSNSWQGKIPGRTGKKSRFWQGKPPHVGFGAQDAVACARAVNFRLIREVAKSRAEAGAG